jgi:hypothetical protein
MEGRLGVVEAAGRSCLGVSGRKTMEEERSERKGQHLLSMYGVFSLDVSFKSNCVGVNVRQGLGGCGWRTVYVVCGGWGWGGASGFWSIYLRGQGASGEDVDGGWARVSTGECYAGVPL